VANVRHVNRPKPWVVEYRTNAGAKRSQSFAKKRDAEAFRGTVETARRRGALVDPAEGRITVTDWSSQWLAIAAADLKPKTVASYRSLLDSRILPALGGCPIATLRPGDVDLWVASMRADGLSFSRIRQAHSFSRQCLSWPSGTIAFPGTSLEPQICRQSAVARLRTSREMS
jgi:hypothetical protein